MMLNNIRPTMFRSCKGEEANPLRHLLPSFFSSLLVLLAAVLLCGSPASAQLAGKGEIKGTVTDPTGAVVPNATVVATSTSRGLKFTTTTSASGDFSVSPLDPDIYSLTVTATGLSTTTQENVHVNALEVANVNISLKLGAESETVTVSAAPPALETSNATLGATMENDMYSALPIQMGAYGQADQRRATDFAFLMPGVQGNNTTGNPTTNTGIVNGSGSRGGVSAVYIDGIPFVRAGGNGDPRFVWTAISVDAVDQFQVQTSGYSAIYEGQGIQNYAIKQGGIKYHGGVYHFFRNTALDTWGFFGAVPNSAGVVSKPVEHSNEYGIYISGPLVPIGSLKDKLFFFGNYNGFRYSSQTPTTLTFPTPAEQAGNFQALTTYGSPNTTGITTTGIYDPNTQPSCTAHSNSGPCRYRYGYGPSGGIGTAGIPVPTGAPIDVIPASELSQVALQLQSYLPSGISNAPQNNYNSPNATGLTNWSTTNRIDYAFTSKDTLTLVAAIGRQASSNPTGQTTSGRNVGPIPYNYGQVFAPKTAVGVIEETHIFTPHVINQFKWGYARYNGPTFQSNQLPQYAAATQGITGLPAGQAAGAFPIVTFAGANAPTNWAGQVANVTLAENYTVLNNVQWNVGKHSFTFGGQIAWLQYNVTPDTGGSSPLTIASAVTETAALNASPKPSSPTFAATTNTGLAYASFLIGQNDKGSLTQNVVQQYNSRFRAISPYVQDNWKVTEKLTLDLGLRWDYFPTLVEAHDNMSFFNPNLANPITGVNGALQFTGTGANTCNCRTPANNYFKNFGPRIGLAYSVDPKTVIRASYGVMYTHGNAVGGGGSTAGLAGNTLGFSASPSFAANGQLLSTMPFTGTTAAFPSFTPATGRASGPAFGTGYTTTAGYTGTPSTAAYYDPYLGGRAPQYINWNFGFQRQWTSALTSNITYVGSQGHFLQADGSNARGFWANQLDPKYLSLGSVLTSSGTSACAANGLTCPANFTTGQQLNVALRPFPFAGVSDQFGNVSNANYHALQATLNMRASHGLTFMANYTWSRSIDDAGTFRSGYAIPAAFSGTGKAYAQDAIERSVSTSNQPHHVVVTGVWDLPFGRTLLDSGWQRSVFGGFKFSTIYQAFSGSPLAITSVTCGTNPAQTAFSSTSTCMPTYNSSFAGPARINGKWGNGVTRTNFNAPSGAPLFINNSAFVATPNFIFGNTARTAPYNIYGPGNYNLDISLRRSFALHLGESSRLSLQADLYNVTNHTQFTVASAVFGNSSFGQVSGTQANTWRRAQLSGRIDF